MKFKFPLVYPILDSSFIPAFGRSEFLERLGRTLVEGGVRLLEYRNKSGTDAEVLADALVLRAAMPDESGIRLVMDDRVDAALAAGFHGVHVDAGDLPVPFARCLIGVDGIVGTSASSEGELIEALRLPVDYVAFGPVFATTTKQTKVEPIGIGGVRRFREIAGDGPVLVAAAGISLTTAGEVLAAGADCVAVAAGIFEAGDPAAEFKRWTRALG